MTTFQASTWRVEPATIAENKFQLVRGLHGEQCLRNSANRILLFDTEESAQKRADLLNQSPREEPKGRYYVLLAGDGSTKIDYFNSFAAAAIVAERRGEMVCDTEELIAIDPKIAEKAGELVDVLTINPIDLPQPTSGATATAKALDEIKLRIAELRKQRAPLLPAMRQARIEWAVRYLLANPGLVK